MQNGQEDLRDPRVRQRFLQENIDRNRASQNKKSKAEKNWMMSDSFFVNRLIEHYENITERNYTQLRNRLSSL